MKKPIYLFDFDGVICNSNREVFKTSLLAYLEYTSSKIEYKDCNNKELYSVFLKYRYKARISSDFYLLWLELLNYNKFTARKNIYLSNKEKEKYKKIFYKIRNSQKKENLNEWIKLHEIYDNIKYFINNLNNNNIFVASAKDTKSIITILEYNNINIKKNHIYGSDRFVDKDEIFKLIKRYKSKSVIKYLDDLNENLIIANKFGIICFLAKWGYENKKINSEFAAIDLTELNRII